MPRINKNLPRERDSRCASGAKGLVFESPRAHHPSSQTHSESATSSEASASDALPLASKSTRKPGTNRGEIEGATHRVLMIKGGHALVSIEDYDRLAAIRWRVKRGAATVYAVAHKPGTDKGMLLMHRFILGAEKGQVVDHRDGWGLNNSRENLRLCTNAENIRNQKAHQTRKTHSKLKGVYRLPDGRWRAQIMVQYKKKNLGTFPDEIAAARAYDAAAKSLHGDFARLNFPEAA